MRTFLQAIQAIMNEYSLDGDGGFYQSPWRLQVEVVTHELAHTLVLGIGYDETDNIRERIARMKDTDANTSEFLTCAVEVLALRAHGVRVSVARLAAFACRMMQTTFYHNYPQRVCAAIEETMKTPRARVLGETLAAFFTCHRRKP